MSIYRKQIEFPEDYKDRLRKAANSAPERFKSKQGHEASVNALILEAVDVFLSSLLTHESEYQPSPSDKSAVA